MSSEAQRVRAATTTVTPDQVFMAIEQHIKPMLAFIEAVYITKWDSKSVFASDKSTQIVTSVSERAF